MCADQAGMVWVGWTQKVDGTRAKTKQERTGLQRGKREWDGVGLKGGRKGKQRRGSKAGALTQKLWG